MTILLTLAFALMISLPFFLHALAGHFLIGFDPGHNYGMWRPKSWYSFYYEAGYISLFIWLAYLMLRSFMRGRLFRATAHIILLTLTSYEVIVFWYSAITGFRGRMLPLGPLLFVGTISLVYLFIIAALCQPLRLLVSSKQSDPLGIKDELRRHRTAG